MKFNLAQMLREKQIDDPYAFLTSNGFTDGPAVKLRKEELNRVQFVYLERLCRILWCTPNDLFMLTAEELQKNPLPPGHPLHALVAHAEVPNLFDKLLKLPIEKLIELNRLIDEGGKK